MAQRKPLLPRLAALAVFLVLEGAALHMVRENASLQRLWFARSAHRVMAATWGTTQHIHAYFGLRDANERLAAENFSLQEELAVLRAQVRHLHTDAATASLPHADGFSYTSAEVVTASRGKQHNYLIINKGFEDGIQEQSGLVTHSGVVGIVISVSAHQAYAYAFRNTDLSISARLGEEGATGLLVWDGHSANRAILKDIPLHFHTAPGDTVYTSGHSRVFPPDIPLGTTGEAKIINGATNEIQVQLFQDFSSVRYVTVVHNDAADEWEGFDL